MIFLPYMNKSLFVCQSCGNEYARWAGKCSACGEWNTLVETPVTKELRSKKSESNSRRKGKIEIVNLSSPSLLTTQNLRLATGITEFDRALGNGLVAGQVVLLSGEPGIGKSTLLLQVAGSYLPNKINLTNSVLYVSGEESANQIKLRSSRLGIKGENINLVPETDVDSLVSLISNTNCSLLIIDSIQTLTTGDLASGQGSVAQVKECTARVINLVKEKGLPTIIVGHVNKEGEIAGPKVLEHMVDTVLYFEGERFGSLRILRVIKNRFGDVGEVGVFEMTEKGFKEIKNPSALFLEERSKGPGSVITSIMEGSRPVLLEVQALVSTTSFNYPRRTASGFDLNRLYFIAAVLEKYLKLPLSTLDVFVNVTGGVKIEEPAADLAVALAIVSSAKEKALRASSLVFGELGLSGEVRSVPSQAKRFLEAKKLGFTNVLSADSVKTLKEAVQKAL